MLWSEEDRRRPDMELGHILWPSDPMTRESSDPETQLTRWPYSIMNSKCPLMLQTNVFNGPVCQFLSLFAFARFWEVKFWRSFIKYQYFNDGWTDFFQKIYIFISLSWVFSKTGKTRVSHRVKMMTRWPGRERWPKWPIDPVTQWPSSMSDAEIPVVSTTCRRRSNSSSGRVGDRDRRYVVLRRVTTHSTTTDKPVNGEQPLTRSSVDYRPSPNRTPSNNCQPTSLATTSTSLRSPRPTWRTSTRTPQTPSQATHSSDVTDSDAMAAG